MLGRIRPRSDRRVPYPVHGYWHSLLLVSEHKFGHRARAQALALRGRAKAPCPSAGTNLNRCLSVPAVFTFLQPAKPPTPHLLPISR